MNVILLLLALMAGFYLGMAFMALLMNIRDKRNTNSDHWKPR